MNAISAEDLADWLAAGRDFILLDVREPWEISTASLRGSTNIPIRALPARAAELPKDREIAVICHHGGRSEAAVRFLRKNGFRASNVEGGIDAYAKRVDRSVPRY